MNKKIKILRIITRLNIGGPAIHVSLLTKGLNPNRFQSVLIAGQISHFEGDMDYFTNELGVKPIIVPTLRREINLFRDIKCLFQLVRILGQEKPDIVHTHTAKAGALGRIAVFIHNLIRKKKKILVVHTFHGHTFSGYFNQITSRVFVWTERLLAAMADTIIAICKSQASELISRYHIAPASKIKTIRLGFNLELFGKKERPRGKFRRSLGIDSQTILIGIIGRLAPIKNHKMLFDAARIFLDQNPEILVKFLVIGDGELRDDLITYCQQHLLSDDILFCGWKRDLPSVYTDLDILALTSINEGTPVSIIEAMASSVPVISTDAGGVRDLLGPPRSEIVSDGFKVCQHGLLCRQKDAKAFAMGIKFLLTNPRIREEILDTALLFAKQSYTKERLLQEVESLYLELLEYKLHKRELDWKIEDLYEERRPHLKVLQVYKDYYPPIIGGVEGHINMLANSLKQRGIEVQVLVSNTEFKLERENINGIEVIKAPQLGRFASAPLNLTFPFYLRRLAREAHIVHFHFPNPTGEISSILARLNNRVVVTYHSDIVRQARLAKFYSPFMHKFLKDSHTIITTSPNYVESSKVLDQFQDKSRVIPFGIDLARFDLNSENSKEIATIRKTYGPSIILFIGRFRYYKGLHVLIEAMRKVKGNLLLIGGGPLERDFRSQVASANLEQRVFFIGEISDRELVNHLHACDVFVLPSVLRSEAFGIVLLEAMACRKPVVCTELGTGTSFVNQHKKTGLVVPSNDTTALTQALNHLLANPEIRENYGKAGRRRVMEHFSKETMISNIIRTYEGKDIVEDSMTDEY